MKQVAVAQLSHVVKVDIQVLQDSLSACQLHWHYKLNLCRDRGPEELALVHDGILAELSRVKVYVICQDAQVL